MTLGSGKNDIVKAAREAAQAAAKRADANYDPAKPLTGSQRLFINLAKAAIALIVVFAVYWLGYRAA